MAKAIDIGTCFIVGAEMRDGREVFTVERDAFYSMPREDFAEQMLDEAGAKYLVRGKNIYVVGEDALRYCMLTGKQEHFRRPMAKGLLNPGEEEAISMLELIVEGIAGKPNFPGEVIAVTSPAAPIEEDMDTAFHRIVIERLLTRLGYDVRILNEALAIIYAENPHVEVNGDIVPFTGVGISFGAGMTNLVVSWRAKQLFEISCARGGDWIDQKVAGVRGLPIGRVTAIKEKQLDLNNIDTKDSAQVALEIYYEDLIKFTLEQFNEYFRQSQSMIDQPLEIVVAGGTSTVPGFIDKFNRVLAEVSLPVPVKGVRHANEALRTVAAGALVAAMSFEKKKRAQGKMPPAPAAGAPATPPAPPPPAPPKATPPGPGTKAAARN